MLLCGLQVVTAWSLSTVRTMGARMSVSQSVIGLEWSVTEDRQKEQTRSCSQVNASLGAQARKPQRDPGVESDAGVPGFLTLSGQVQVGGLSISHTLLHLRG